MGASLIQPLSWGKEEEGLRVVNQPVVEEGLHHLSLRPAGNNDSIGKSSPD